MMYSKAFIVIFAFVCRLANGGKLETFIVGGKYAKDGAFPFQVSLQDGKLHFCGGSIVNFNWILTAAHCLNEVSQNKIEILAGSNQVNSAQVRRKVSKVVFIKQYVAPITNDIVLLKLSSSLPTNNPRIKAVNLPTEYTRNGTRALVTGWGYNQTGHNPQNDLKVLQTITITNEQCQTEYVRYTISSTNICAYTRRGEGFCNGDSGGPLIDLRSFYRRSPVQIGIVSGGLLCALGKPDIYTRVLPYVEEIKKIIRT